MHLTATPVEGPHEATQIGATRPPVDVLTDRSGSAVEHRSYDPFGQRRNPVWGQQPPASFPSLTTVGYTGQEADDELGLVNMKGRLYDPKAGRFLTIDPVVADPLSAQSWNAYAYVENNPLNFVDPSGFEYTPPPVDPAYGKDPEVQRIQAAECAGLSGLECSKGTSPPVKQVEGPREATQVGATRTPVDVSTTGSASGQVPQPAAAVTQDWKQNPWVQLLGGFVGGVALGIVPFAGAGQQLLDHGHVIPPGTPETRRGLAVGQIVGGMIAIVGGVTGEVGGGVLSLTGVGALAGVPAMVVSAGVITGGVANIGAGIRGLMTTGSGSGGNGRAGRQERLREIGKDPNTSSADRGWIKQETDRINRGQRTTIRNPPGKDLAHARGREAAKGYDHVESPSNLQNVDDHRTQHKFDDYGRANKERP